VAVVSSLGWKPANKPAQVRSLLAAGCIDFVSLLHLNSGEGT
jgi:hypothetical protein